MAFYKGHRYVGRKRNERNKSRLAVILFFLFVIAVIFGSVRLGLYLRDKAERAMDTGEGTSENTSLSDIPDSVALNSAPEKIEAEFFSLLSADADNYLEKIDENAENGSAISLIFRNTAGKLMYNSEAAQTLTGVSDIESPTCSELVSSLKDKGCYVSAIISLSSIGKGDYSQEDSSDSGMGDDSRVTFEALEAFDIALVRELVLAGVDEVIFAGLDCSSDFSRAICDFSRRLREKISPEIPFGLIIPYDVFEGEGSSKLCLEYSKSFEILAVDYTDVSGDKNASAPELVRSRIDNMQLYFSRYNMRIVFDCDDESLRSDFEAVLDSAAIYNSQYLSLSELIGKGT